jgi:hypothetical protein
MGFPIFLLNPWIAMVLPNVLGCTPMNYIMIKMTKSRKVKE